MQDPTQYVTAGRGGDGDDDGADDEGDGDDDPNEVQLDGGDDGDDFPLSGRNFPGRFLPAGELFSLWCFPPCSGGETLLALYIWGFSIGG